MKRLRWRTIFFLEETNKTNDLSRSDETENSKTNSPSSNGYETSKNTYDFKSSATLGFVKELKGLESVWWKLVDSVKFNQFRSKFQIKLKKDCGEITKSKMMLIYADKTRNVDL